MSLTIELEHEADGRWLAEATELPGVTSYGQSAREAVEKAQVLALRVIADRLELGENVPPAENLFRVIPELWKDEQAKDEARLRLRRLFGAVALDQSNTSDNELIDADLAREYGDTHEAE